MDNSTTAIFKAILGNAWTALPKPIQEMHDTSGDARMVGLASVERGRGIPARLIASLFRFPLEGAQIPVEVLITKTPGHETWLRTFGGRSFSSVLSAGTARADKLLTERFGPFSFQIALVVEDEKLKYIVRDWKFCGVLLPRSWAPRGDTYESSKDGLFGFDIEIGHPLAGLIVKYSGNLAIAKLRLDA
jgi:hypothetical protein